MTPMVAALRLVERNVLVYRRDWPVFVTGFLEPVLYLLSIGVGVGALVGGFDIGGRHVPYATFVAPGMLATSAMNGAIMDATYNIFHRLRYAKLYDAVLATPMTTRALAVGETTWALLRGAIYSAGFLVVMLVMGMVTSWWALLALPATMLIGFAFAGVGMWATTYMRSWQDFELVGLVTMPLMMLSGTFYPVERYPDAARWLVEATPLYRGVVLCRELTTGELSLASLVSVVYLLVLGTAGMLAADRRLSGILLR